MRDFIKILIQILLFVLEMFACQEFAVTSVKISTNSNRVYPEILGCLKKNARFDKARIFYQNKVRNVLELQEEIRRVLNELDGAMCARVMVNFMVRIIACRTSNVG